MSDNEKQSLTERQSFRSRLEQDSKKKIKNEDLDVKKMIITKRDEIKEIQDDLKGTKKTAPMKITSVIQTIKSDVTKQLTESSILNVDSEFIPRQNQARKLTKLNQSLKIGKFNGDDQSMLSIQQRIIQVTVTRQEDQNYQELFDILNHITDQEFETGGRHLVFKNIDNKINDNNEYIIIHIQDIKYTNPKDLLVASTLELKIDTPQYFWEVKLNNLPLYYSAKKNFDNIAFECLDFIYQNNNKDPIDIILWKSQFQQNFYIGQFSIEPSIFEQLEDVKIFKKRQLRAVRKTIVKLEKKQQEIRKILGQIEIEYQVIQYSQKQLSEPKNSISNVRGSPKAGDKNERKKRQKVENIKDGYEWEEDSFSKEQIEIINKYSEEYNQQITLEEAQSRAKQIFEHRVLNLLSEYKHQQRQLSRSFTFKKERVHKFEQTQNLLAKNEQQSEIERIRISIQKGRVTKEDIYNTLQKMGASVSEIFVIQSNELMHEMLNGLNIGLFLDIIPSMNLEQNEVLEIVAEQLFQTIIDYLRQKKRLLQPLVNFIKAIINRPEFGVIVAQFADQYQNSRPKRKIINDKGEIEFVNVPIVFLEHFDINRNHPYKMDNYEHIVLLAKIRKLIRLYLNKDSLFFQDIEQAYRAAKTSLYFVLPKLPKNLKEKFNEKKDLIILGEWRSESKGNQNTYRIQESFVRNQFFKIQKQINQEANQNTYRIQESFVRNQFFKIQEQINQESLFPLPCLFNIFHESVRRKRWNNLYRGFIAAPDYYYQKDSSERTPLSALLEQGPFDIIRQFFQDFSNNQRGEFEDTRPCIDIIKLIYHTTTRQNKNCLHFLSLNKIPNPQSQLKCLQILIKLLPEDQVQKLQNQAILGINITPVCAFLNTQSIIQNRLFGEDTETIQDMINLLSNKVDFNISFYKFHTYLVTVKNRFSEKKLSTLKELEPHNTEQYINNVVQIARVLSTFDFRSYQIISPQFQWINWFGLSFDGLVNYDSIKIDDTEQSFRDRNGYSFDINNDVQFLIFNLARNQRYKLLQMVLEKYDQQIFQIKPKVMQNQDIVLDHQINNGVFLNRDLNSLRGYQQVEVQGKKENQLINIIEFQDQDHKEEFFKNFYEKYPLDALLGLVQIFEEQKDYNSLKENQIFNYLIKLIIQIVQEEPRTLAKCLSLIRHKENPFRTVKHLLAKYKIDISQLIPSNHLQMLDIEYESIFKLIQQDPLLHLKQQNKIFNKLVKNKEVEAFLNYISTIIHSNDLAKGVRDQIIAQSKQIIQLIFDNFQKLETQVSFNWLANWLKNNYVDHKFLWSLIKKPLFQAFYKNNTVLMHQVLSVVGFYPQLSQGKVNYLITQIKYSQRQHNYYQSLKTHYALELDMAQFRQCLLDTQDITKTKDFEHMAYIIAINGLYDKLSLIISKIQDTELILYLFRQVLIQQNQYLGIYDTKMKKGTNDDSKQQKFTNITEKYQDIMKIKQHLIFMQDPIRQVNGSSQIYRKNPKQYTLPQKFKYYISQWGSEGDKKTYYEIYLQKLRQSFLNQKLSSLFYKQLQNDAQSYEQTLKQIIDYLKIDKIKQIQDKDLKFVQQVTKKAYLLPLYHDACDLLFLAESPKVAILKAVDFIIQYQLRKYPNYNIRNDQKQKQQRCINFIKKYFNSDLVELFNNTKYKYRIYRIIRTLYITLERSQDDYNVQFAIQVLLVIVQKWKQDDFKVIIENSQNLFKSFAVVMVRSQTRNQDAITFIRQQLDGKQLFQLKFWFKKDIPGYNLKQNRDLIMYPDKIEVEMTQQLITVNIKNLEYLTFLYKSQVKPFLDNYKGKFSNKIGQNLNKLEYLVYKKYENFIKCKNIMNIIEFLMDEMKRIQLKDQNDQLRWIYIGITTGNVQTLQFVTQNILRLDEKQVFLKYIKKDKEILKLLVKQMNEEQLIKYLTQYMMPFQCDGDYMFIQDSLEPIIQKKYSRLWKFLCDYILQTQNGNNSKFSDVCQKLILSNMKEDNITYLEYSLNEGFMDLINLDIYSDKEQIGELIKECLKDKKVHSRIARNLQIQNNNLNISIQNNNLNTSIQNNNLNALSQNYKYQKFFDAIHKYFTYDVRITTYYKGIRHKLTELDGFNNLRLIIMLFDISRRYLNYDYMLDTIPSQKELLVLLFKDVEQAKHFIHKDIDENYLLLLYHINGFDKVSNYRLSIIDYFNKCQSTLFWTNKEIQQLLLTLFDIDIINIKQKMEIPDIETLNQLVCSSGHELRQYMLMNQPIIIHNSRSYSFKQDEQDVQITDPQQIFNNDQIALLKAEDVILQIRSQSINDPKFKQFILSIKYHLDYDTNGIFYRSLFAISFINFDYHVDYIMRIIDADFDSKLHPFTQLLLYGINKYGLIQLSAQINQLIQSLKTNSVYHLLMQYPLSQNNPLSIDLIKEKYIIEGLNDFLAQIQNREGLKFRISKKDIEKCLYDNSNQDKLYTDKIYKGFIFVKIYLDLAQEIDQFQQQTQFSYSNGIQEQQTHFSYSNGIQEQQINENTQNRFEYDIITQSYSMKDISQQQITVKTYEIIQTDKEQLYKLSVQMPLLLTDYKGFCYIIIPQHVIAQLLEKQKIIIFDSYIVKQLNQQVQQESIEFQRKYNHSVGINMKGVSFDNYPYFFKNQQQIINPRHINLDKLILDLQYYPNQEEKQVGVVKTSDKIVNYKQRATITLEQELNYSQFHKAEYEITLVSLNQKQFKEQNQLSKILRKLIDDIIAFQLQKPKVKIKLEWPYLIESKFRQYIFPTLLLNRVISSTKIFDLGMVNINYMSLIETYLIKWSSILEQSGKQKNLIDLEIMLSIAFKWPLFEYILKESIDQVSSYIDRSRIIIDFGETLQQANTKGIYFQGYDQIARFGQNNYSYYLGHLVIRLNILFIRFDINPILDLMKQKKRQQTAQGDIQIYIDAIMNRDELISVLQQIQIK